MIRNDAIGVHITGKGFGGVLVIKIHTHNEAYEFVVKEEQDISITKNAQWTLISVEPELSTREQCVGSEIKPSPMSELIRLSNEVNNGHT